MLYQEFLDHIYKKYSGNVKLELDRMRNLMTEMGDPQTRLDGFHIAGTNGKGSVCATLEALCIAHGLSTGMNTSPHLINYTERFRVGGKDLSFPQILDCFHRYETLFEKWDASFFEISTAIAFELFVEAELDCSVIEVGLGGRLDATNLFTPSVTAITSIGLDHIKTLGGTVELIAAEKAGIIKAGIPLVMGYIDPSPSSVIEAIALERNAPIFMIGRDFHVDPVNQDIDGICFNFRFGELVFESLGANLIGSHQSANLSVALAAFIIYAQKHGIAVSEEAIRSALEKINWKGRMQVLSKQPVIILDGAHNVQGVQALIHTLDNIFPQQKLRFLISILADKDYLEMISLFCSKAFHIYIAQNQSDRAATAEDQAKQVGKHSVPYTIADSVAAALNLALSDMESDDVLICCGSLYTVGEVLQEWKEL
ncbi:MAG: folylpolyglutamate synthase/dihydrofolate synthase family protein [Candidatus Cloacimonadaceae bacterium]|nr:folylpolyglutamate synthase/dihydrofolate synthase family protein [Candidatus Cloacimonadaceae bacterium]